MVNDKILSKLLRYNNHEASVSNFDPLTSQETAENVAKSICKILIITQNAKSSQLKANLRNSIVELAQSMCKVKYSDDVLLCPDKTRIDIILKYTCCVEKTEAELDFKHRRRKKLNELFEQLNLLGIQNFNYTKTSNIKDNSPVINLNLGTALINISSKHSRIALNNKVNTCLKSDAFDDQTYEFLSKVWSYNQLIIPIEVFDNLSERLVCLLEINFLNLSEELMNLSDSEFFHNIECLIDKYFPNKHVIFNRMSQSSHMFMKVFLVLNDIFVTACFECNIQKLIQYILQEVRCRSLKDNLVNLYYYDLRSTAFYLESNPDVLCSKIPELYKYTKDIMEKLCKTNKFAFILLLSHYELWFSHCMVDNVKIFEEVN